MKTAIVTGATSMLGVATIKAMLANQSTKKVFAIVQPNSKNLKKLPVDDRIVTIECLAKDYKLLPEFVDERCDVFYHYAWEPSLIKDRSRYFDIDVARRNIGYALDAYDIAYKLGCHSFVGAGSQAEYGPVRKDVQRPEDWTNPITTYGVAKDTVRRLLEVKANQYGVSVQWVRIFSVYGVNDRPNTLISSILRKMLRNETIDLTTCQQIWDYLFDEDAGRALYMIGEHAEGSNIYCLGSGSPRPLKEFIVEMQRITGSSSKINYGAIEYGKSDVMCLNPDIASLIKDTGWLPRVAFEDGIKMIINSIICDEFVNWGDNLLIIRNEKHNGYTHNGKKL